MKLLAVCPLLQPLSVTTMVCWGLVPPPEPPQFGVGAVPHGLEGTGGEWDGQGATGCSPLLPPSQLIQTATSFGLQLVAGEAWPPPQPAKIHVLYILYTIIISEVSNIDRLMAAAVGNKSVGMAEALGMEGALGRNMGMNILKIS